MLPVPKNLPNIELTVFNSGWVTANKKMVMAGAKKEKILMPATYAMIRHPEKGLILYDTGYHTKFYKATKYPPYRIMRYLTPAKIEEEDNVDRKLEKMGIPTSEVNTIILGHGHVDHVPGVIYFPQAKLIMERKEWESMQGPALKVFTKGYITSLYKGITNEMTLLDLTSQGTPYGPFDCALDLWGDSSMILVPLPGHTPGQMGLLVNLPDGRTVFFIGDATWLRENYILNKLPAFIVRAMLASFTDFKATVNLLHNFHKEHPEVTIVPCHCPDAWEELKGMGLAG